MATIEQEGVLSFVNEEGNIVEMYPEVKTDDTLSISGKAADAKAVGDKIAEIEDVIDNEVADLETKINSFDDAKPEIVGSGLGTALSMSTNDSWNDITGAISGVANKGNWNGNISTSGGSIIIPKGYHNGSGKVTGPTRSDLIGTNVTLASAAKLLSGVTAYGKNGTKYTGTNKGYDAGYEDGQADAPPTYKYGTWTPTYNSTKKGCYLSLGFKPNFVCIVDTYTINGNTCWSAPLILYCDHSEVSILEHYGNLHTFSVTPDSTGVTIIYKTSSYDSSFYEDTTVYYFAAILT